MWVSHYFLGEEHKDAKGLLDLAGRWPTCLIKCSNGLLGRRRSQSLKCLGLFLGLLHGKKCEILLTFCNNLLKRKNYKAIWEATPHPASVVFGGGFPPLEKQARNSSGPLETGGLERPSRANPQRRGCCRAESSGTGTLPPTPPLDARAPAAWTRQGPMPGTLARSELCGSPQRGSP